MSNSPVLPSIVLCYKCGGNLTTRVPGLYFCSCTSGRVHGFGPMLTVEQAINTQLATCGMKIEFYEERDAAGDADRIADERRKIVTLTALKHTALQDIFCKTR